MDSSPANQHSARSLIKPVESPLRDLLLLSPSPLRRSAKVRLADRLEIAEGEDHAGLRRRYKTRAPAPGSPSPRNARRSVRRRAEVETGREEKDSGFGEEASKPRKRRHSVRARKEKLILVPYSPPPLPSSISSVSPKLDEEIESNLDRIGQLTSDLVMWRDAAKSSFWFGVGSLFFFSSCFVHGLTFSVFSAISKLGILLLGVSFFSNSVRQSNGVERNCEFGLTEDDVLRVARVILPFVNFAALKLRAVFSGEPSMTLKVTPFLLLGAEYGHLMTVWRFCAIGFVTGFTLPVFYSRYSSQISQIVEFSKSRAIERWGDCSHKKIVAASAATAFWNLSTIKTRVFMAFISLVLLRCCRQNIAQAMNGKNENGNEDAQVASADQVL